MNPFNPNKNHTDPARWICIYPSYINSKKTKQEGRIVPKSRAVENPTHQEIAEVLNAHGFRHGVENKLYSREPSKEMLYRGRIRVQLRKDDGSPLNAAYPNRESIMFLLTDYIPKLKSRQGKQGTSDTQQAGSSSSGGAGKKGKGKGKR